MTETPDAYYDWLRKTIWEPPDVGVSAFGKAAFKAGHAAGRLEERADVLAEVDKTMREVWHEQAPPFNKRSDALERLAATMLERVRALVKDENP